MARSFSPATLPEAKGPQQDDLDPLEVLLKSQGKAPVDGKPQVTEQPDGSAVVDFNPGLDRNTEKALKTHNANLADHIEENELNRIGMEVLEGINRDIQSRQEWLDNYARGMRLLGLTIEENSPDAGTASDASPLEGMCRVNHPMLLEAVLLFQANARGELLPASGPVKVRNDTPPGPPSPQTPPPMPAAAPGGPASPLAAPQPPPHLPSPSGAVGAPIPPQPGIAGGGVPPAQMQQQAQMPQMPNLPPQISGLPGGMPQMPPMPQMPEAAADDLADALEMDFNHYLTVTDKQYYPDTDKMFFGVGFCGIGVKKVYHCPIRRRPVSETVPIEDFIVSNALSDLSNSGRITHRIKMRPSQLKRMQILKAYRDTPIPDPVNDGEDDQVDQAKAEIVGVQVKPTDPRDADYTIYECYTELKLDQFAPTKLKGEGLALPYKVTIEKNSQKVLEIRRNWKKDDDQALPREYFVDFPFGRGFGFYGIGYLHILGNTTKTLTAAWRLSIDSGMFSNFPGFIYAKGAGRQLTNQFRVPPGGGVGLDVGLQSLKDSVMPLPYQRLGQEFTNFIQHVEEIGERLGSTAMSPVAEGKQDAPVGTTLALIEQSGKPTAAVMKRLHEAQGKEFQLLKERFQEDPEAFWRFNRKPTRQWDKQTLIQALNDYDIVPVSDPANPTKMHRAAKGMILQQMMTTAPLLFDLHKGIEKVGRAFEMEDDIEDCLKSPEEIAQAQAAQQQGPSGPQLDPNKQAELQFKAQDSQNKAQAEIAKRQMDTQAAALENQQQAAETDSRVKIALINQQSRKLELATEMARHADTIDMNERNTMRQLIGDTINSAADQQNSADQQQMDQSHALALQQQQHAHDAGMADLQRQHEQQLAELQANQDQGGGE